MRPQPRPLSQRERGQIVCPQPRPLSQRERGQWHALNPGLSPGRRGTMALSSPAPLPMERASPRPLAPGPSSLASLPRPSARSTADRGSGWDSARNWPARTARSSIRCRSRGCTASTARWGRVRSAKVLATSSASTWTSSFPTRPSRCAKGPSPRGTRRRTPTN